MNDAAYEQIPENVVRMVLEGDERRRKEASVMFSHLTDRERALVREAAVMGYVNGMTRERALSARPAGHTYPDDRAVIAEVLLTCRSMPDLYPNLGYLTDREGPSRDEGSQSDATDASAACRARPGYDTCDECKGFNPAWFTDDATWRKHVPEDKGMGAHGFGTVLCPRCFAARVGFDTGREVRENGGDGEDQVYEAVCAALAAFTASSPSNTT